jgi:uncharacterized cupin superfamily protein
MKKLYLLGVFIMATVVMPAHGEISVVPLNKEVMKGAELESIPPWPEGVVLSGANEHWQKVMHQGDFVVALYESEAALIDVSYPFSYDEFVTVLEGRVILTSLSGEKPKSKSPKAALALGSGFLNYWTGIFSLSIF